MFEKRKFRSYLFLFLLLSMLSVMCSPFLKGASDIPLSFSSKNGQTLLVDAEGNVWTWGKGNMQRLIGDVHKEYEINNEPVFLMFDAVTVERGMLQNMILKADGSLWIWGENDGGQIGPSGTGNIYHPRHLMDNIKAISAGATYSLALREDGVMIGWGSNAYGQLGSGSKFGTWAPPPHGDSFPMIIMENVSAISAGSLHALALQTDGSCWAWGDNQWGQLGNGLAEFHNYGSGYTYEVEPYLVMKNIVQIAAGSRHSLALDEDGTVWQWGNTVGQYLDGGGSERGVQAFPVMDHVVGIAAEAGKSLALKDDGSVWQWNVSYLPESLMEYTQQLQLIEQPHKVFEDAVAIASTDGGGLALKRDRTLWGWGRNEYGQLKNGLADSVTEPIVIWDQAQAPIIDGAMEVGNTPSFYWYFAIISFIIVIVGIMIVRRTMGHQKK